MANEIALSCFRYDLYLSFEESIFGGQREIKVSCSEVCGSCSGTGAKSSSSVKLCTACGGRGGVMKIQKTPFGVLSQVTLARKELEKHRLSSIPMIQLFQFSFFISFSFFEICKHVSNPMGFQLQQIYLFHIFEVEFYRCNILNIAGIYLLQVQWKRQDYY